MRGAWRAVQNTAVPSELCAPQRLLHGGPGQVSSTAGSCLKSPTSRKRTSQRNAGDVGPHCVASSTSSQSSRWMRTCAHAHSAEVLHRSVRLADKAHDFALVTTRRARCEPRLQRRWLRALGLGLLLAAFEAPGSADSAATTRSSSFHADPSPAGGALPACSCKPRLPPRAGGDGRRLTSAEIASKLKGASLCALGRRSPRRLVRHRWLGFVGCRGGRQQTRWISQLVPNKAIGAGQPAASLALARPKITCVASLALCWTRTTGTRSHFKSSRSEPNPAWHSSPTKAWQAVSNLGRITRNQSTADRPLSILGCPSQSRSIERFWPAYPKLSSQVLLGLETSHGHPSHCLLSTIVFFATSKRRLWRSCCRHCLSLNVNSSNPLIIDNIKTLFSCGTGWSCPPKPRAIVGRDSSGPRAPRPGLYSCLSFPGGAVLGSLATYLNDLTGLCDLQLAGRQLRDLRLITCQAWVDQAIADVLPSATRKIVGTQSPNKAGTYTTSTERTRRS